MERVHLAKQSDPFSHTRQIGRRLSVADKDHVLSSLTKSEGNFIMAKLENSRSKNYFSLIV